MSLTQVQSGMLATFAFANVSLSGTTTANTIGAVSGSVLSLVSNGTTNATLDTNGNFGLGVTPSSWGSNFVAQEIGPGCGIYANRTSGQDCEMFSNFYTTNSAGYYKQTGYATRYAQSQGNHYWYTAPSGTAGSSITFSQAMALNNSGTLVFNQSGQGIQFTNSSALTNSTLNDYETGTWTPKCGDGSTAMTTINKATYAKIGNRVFIDIDVVLPATNPSNANYITNLPFAGSSSTAGNGGGGVAYTTLGIALGFHVTSSTTTMYGYNNITNATPNLGGGRIIMGFVYQTSF
jgi:hypothetical protein